MKFVFFALAVTSYVCLVTPTTQAFGIADQATSRRAWFHQGMAGVTAVAVTTLLPPISALAAVEPTTTSCPPRSNNCIVTTWTAPADSKKDLANQVLEILQSYPQEGQADVDKGGWTVVSSNDSTPIRVEYKSGIGNFAKYFNGGKPFVDDLVVSISATTGNDTTNAVTIRSSSRVGDSDMGVNQKRLQYLGTQARALGWTVPEPKY